MRKCVFLIIFLFSVKEIFSQWHYPATKTVDSSDTYFGVTYKDPYRWLESMKDPAVVEWFKAQSDLTRSILDNISGRDELIAEWKRLDKLQPPKINGRDYENGRIFYRKTMPGEKVAKIYYRQGMSGQEILLFDPLSYIKGKTLSVTSILPSFDGSKILIAYSEGGAEVSYIKIMNVATRKFYPETIYPSWFGPISWAFDNKSFFYFSQHTSDNTDPTFELHTKTKIHVLGTDVRSDADFFSDAVYTDLGIKDNDLPFAGLNKDSKNYVFADLGNVRPEMFTYFAPISLLHTGKIPWKLLCEPKDQIVRGREIIGDDVYAITYKDAKNYKLIHTTLPNPDWANANTIAPENPKLTLESITHCRDYLFLSYSDGINSSIDKYDFKSKAISHIKLPYSGAASIFCIDNKTNQCGIGITSWNRAYTEYNFDASTDKFSPSTFNKTPVYPDAYKNLIVEEVEAKGEDGTMIPLSLIYRKGTKKDGSNVCLIEGYGAYGNSNSPYFDNLEASLAVKGVIIAQTHVRGGSEKGQAWYKAGYKSTKPNTWKDFNSCAEYLIDNKYTSPDRLAGTGTSAGGILISRAITERPELYAAAICNVGCANAMRMEFAPNGPANIPEFGTVKDSAECLALYAMDGVKHVVPGTRYPAVICVGGWNDPRVIAWEPGKFAAALQNASSSGKPVLMKVNYENGHFTEDKSVTYANFADQYAFAMWQCGHPDFKIKKQQGLSGK